MRLSLAGVLGKRKSYRVAQTDELRFDEGKLALAESVEEDDSTVCIQIMLANISNTTIRVHKEENLRATIPAITKWVDRMSRGQRT